MAKNKDKKRKQTGPQNRAAHDEQVLQRPSPQEQEMPSAGVAGSPANTARKQHKRFGHN